MGEIARADRVCTDASADMSGDICCAAGWELSTVGVAGASDEGDESRGPDLDWWDKTLALATHKYSHTCKDTHMLPAHVVHTSNICLSHMQNVEDIGNGKDNETRKDNQ